jgi:hypothetical protein
MASNLLACLQGSYTMTTTLKPQKRTRTLPRKRMTLDEEQIMTKLMTGKISAHDLKFLCQTAQAWIRFDSFLHWKRNFSIINLLSQPLGADQAVYAHTVKAPAPSLSLGGVWSTVLDVECGTGSIVARPRTEAHAGVCLCVHYCIAKFHDSHVE